MAKNKKSAPMDMQSIREEAVQILQVLAQNKGRDNQKLKADSSGITRLHLGFEINGEDLRILANIRTRRKRIEYLNNILGHWQDMFAQELIDRGFISAWVSPVIEDCSRVRVSLGMGTKQP